MYGIGGDNAGGIYSCNIRRGGCSTVVLFCDSILVCSVVVFGAVKPFRGGYRTVVLFDVATVGDCAGRLLWHGAMNSTLYSRDSRT